MDFKKLRTFQCAAQTLHFSEAADRLGYVQSAVTNQIKSLEEELDTRLFERNGRGVELTTSGQQLLHYTKKILNMCEEAKTIIATTQKNHQIKIAGNDTILTYYLPKILSQYRLQNKEIRFSIQQIPVAHLKRELLAGNLDLVFILEKPFMRQGLTAHIFKEEEIVLVCSPSHPLAKKIEISSHDLIDEHVILTEQGCCYRNQFERILINAGAYSTANISEFASIEAIKVSVKLNIGIAALSLSSVSKELDQEELVSLQLKDTEMISSIHCITDDNRDYPEPIESFIKFCQSYELSTE
ncbi:LysR family transcriptional regulator [Spongorhabdus nitratireducens]